MVVRRKKYRLTKSNIICQPKDQGGLGVQNIELQNQCLLSKWLFKLLNKDGLWQTILRKKYLANQTLGKAQKRPGVSHFWASLMDAKQSFLRYGSFQLNNGKQIRFWEDKWLGNSSFQYQYPSVYNIVRKKSDTVVNVLGTIPLNVSFRRSLQGNNLALWNDLVFRVMYVQLND
jgi:hypothetical protein